MRRRLRVIGAVGGITRLFSFAFLLPALIALGYDSWATPDKFLGLPQMFWVFGGCFAGSFLTGLVMRRIARDAEVEGLRDQEAYLVVGLGWLFLCALAMIPFLFTSQLRSPIDAYFEAMSGLTTTGATAIAGALEDVDPSIHIWRGLLQFIGGMGIIVLGIAVLARLTHGGVQLLQAETPGPTVTRMAPRLAHTARISWGVYLAFAAVCYAALFAVMSRHGMGFKQTVYEALMHTLTTISTGGFSNHTQSIAFFDDWLLETVIIFFILLSGINYTLHYYWIRGDGGKLLRDPETRFFLSTYLIVVAIVTSAVALSGFGWSDGLRGSMFTVASFITSTGYTTADYDQWPDVAKLFILVLMVTGATAGSTSGGMKHVRVLVLLKLAGNQIRRIVHPRAVVPVRLGGRIMKPETVTAVAAFAIAFLAMGALGTLLLTIFDPLFSNPMDAASASVAMLGNMGPALGVVGPTQNYAAVAPWSKLLLAFMMWFGRLEVFAALVVFTPKAWR